MLRKEALILLKALGHESRYRVFRHLIKAGPQGMSAGAIARRLKVPKTTLSFHLSELKSTGLIQCRASGTSLIYTANHAVIKNLVAYVTERICDSWPG